jgi:hypothetical protein
VPQNQVGYGLSVAPTKSRSSSLLRLEVSQARVSQSSLKIGGGTTQVVHVVSSQRSHGDEAEDDGLMRLAASDSSTPTLMFSLY